MPQKYFADQFDDEDVLYVFRKHPVVMRRGLVWGSVGLLAGPLYTLALTYIHANNPEKFPSINFFLLSLLGGLLFGLLLFAPSWIAWYYSVFIVTNQRFIQSTQRGLFHRTWVDMRLDHIQSINYQVDGFQETLLGFGTILIQTYIGDMVIHDVHHPPKIQKKLLQILREQGITPTPPPLEEETDET